MGSSSRQAIRLGSVKLALFQHPRYETQHWSQRQNGRRCSCTDLKVPIRIDSVSTKDRPKYETFLLSLWTVCQRPLPKEQPYLGSDISSYRNRGQHTRDREASIDIIPTILSASAADVLPLFGRWNLSQGRVHCLYAHGLCRFS